MCEHAPMGNEGQAPVDTRRALTDPRRFVEENTGILTLPLLPEIPLHLAAEMFPLWQLTEAELTDTGLPPPFWAFAWAGGQAVARYVLDTPDVVRNKRVLDFATGCGLIGIAAARAGAREVTAVDIDPIAVAASGLNAERNGVAIHAEKADWIGRPLDDFDVVVAGDVFYERPMADDVQEWLKGESARGLDVIIGDPGRTYLPKDGLVEIARYCVATTRELEDTEVRRTLVWRFAENAAQAALAGPSSE